ncbi:MAG: metallophosphoesterase [Lachnospiraceae bacterium]
MNDWLFILIAIVCGLACFFLLVMVIDGNRFRLVSYHLKSKKINKPYRFVLLADLHNKSYGRGNEKLLERIRYLQPEAIFMAGDMLTAKAGCAYDNTIDLINSLSADYPVYFSMGNHESRLCNRREAYGDLWDIFEEKLTEAGVVLLRNQQQKTKENIQISGLEIDRRFYSHFKLELMSQEYLNQTLGKADRSRYQILLAHNPDYFDRYAAWGADLVLAGHVHGGIMRLPLLGGVISPALKLFPRYDGGMFRQGESVMILSRGLGMHTLPVRIFNPGELVLITLSPEKQP